MPTTLTRSNAAEQHRETYRTAVKRLETHVTLVAHAKGMPITLEVSPSWSQGASPKSHLVALRNGKGEAVVRVDHESLTDNDDFFRDFVLPQILDAIDTLAAR